jgi:hypothetical protein
MDDRKKSHLVAFSLFDPALSRSHQLFKISFTGSFAVSILEWHSFIFPRLYMLGRDIFNSKQKSVLREVVLSRFHCSIYSNRINYVTKQGTGNRCQVRSKAISSSFSSSRSNRDVTSFPRKQFSRISSWGPTNQRTNRRTDQRTDGPT